MLSIASESSISTSLPELRTIKGALPDTEGVHHILCKLQSRSAASTVLDEPLLQDLCSSAYASCGLLPLSYDGKAFPIERNIRGVS